MHGPEVPMRGALRKAYLISSMGDASRLIAQRFQRLLDGEAGDDTLIGAGRAKDVLSRGGGSDLFVLGDGTDVFYADGTIFEGSGYALIPDFSNTLDTIQLTGAPSDYALQSDYSVDGMTGTGLLLL